DTPTPAEVGKVAGNQPFQSMSCLTRCGPSERFCSIAWDKTVAWCSYTVTRRPLAALTYEALVAALEGLGVEFCGGTEDDGDRLSGSTQYGYDLVRRR